MTKFLKLCGAAVITLSLSACADTSIDPNAFYGDLSAAEKTKYMDAILTKMNAAPQQDASVKVHYTADVERGLIISHGTYPKPVSDEQLEKAGAALAKAELQNPTCYKPEAIVFARHGLSLQAIMRDPNGKVLYESELCEGSTFAHRPYAEMTEEQQAETLARITKGLDAKAKSMNSNPKSIYAVTFESDSVKDVIYGTHQFIKKLSDKATKQVKAEYGDVTESPEVCTGEEVVSLNENGIRFEYRIVDVLGENIVTPWVCPAGNAVTLSAVPKLRGQIASR